MHCLLMMMTMRVKQTDDGRIWFQIEEKRTTERASESAITKEKEKISEKAYDEIEGKKTHKQQQQWLKPKRH